MAETETSRAQYYGLLAQALSHPVGEVLDALAEDGLRAEIELCCHSLPYGLSVSSLDVESVVLDQDELRYCYTSNFEIGNAPLVLRESSYSSKSEKEIFEDLFRFFNFFGLDFSQGGLKESPDHVAIELEFMHYLCFLEGQSTDNLASLRAAQKDFIQRHLYWLESLREDSVKHSRLGPYQSVMENLAEFIKADEAWLLLQAS